MECEKCGKEHDGSYGSGRFCSSYCARSYSTSKDTRSTKIVKCIECGKDIEVDKRASTKLCKCDDCRKQPKYISGEKHENCLNCGKRLITKQHKFCSHQCRCDYKYEEYIRKWKNGELNGSREEHDFILSSYVRRYLWKKYDGKCSRCGWNTPNPLTGKPILEIEHIDGDCTNNKEENLDLICPNCHSLTTTYKALNTGKGNRKRLEHYKLI